MNPYSEGVSVNGYPTNSATPPQPMIHLIGRDDGEQSSLTFTPEDARKVAAMMIQFANQIDALGQVMEWRL